MQNQAKSTGDAELSQPNVQKGAEDYPLYLNDYGSLLSHLNSQFDDLSTPEKSQEKGDRFVEFAVRVVAQLPVSGDYERPQLNEKKTHDKGVDFSCDRKDGGKGKLLGQSKYTIREVQEFDSVISKLKAFVIENKHVPTPDKVSKSRSSKSNAKSDTPTLFENLEAQDIQVYDFVLVTGSDLQNIIAKYEKVQLGSRDFYDLIQAEKRLHIIDGPKVFNIVKSAHRKQFKLPSNLKLQMITPCIDLNPVYIGVVSGQTLKNLYEEFGTALFIDNVREFLGNASGRVNPNADQVPVNAEIERTLRDEPEKFLSRNNGITFRAAEVVPNDDAMVLTLNDASIVNGCQTTMSIVDNPSEASQILVKVVTSTNSWDIAEAANYQNEIRQLDLRLARYIRPQEIRSAASKFEMGFKGESDTASAYALLDTFYKDEISYEEAKGIFIGLFSNRPNYALAGNYARLESETIAKVFESSDGKEQTFRLIFKLHGITRVAAHKAQQKLKEEALFRRLISDDRPNYRAFMAVFAMMGAMRRNIYADGTVSDYDKMMTALKEMERIIDLKPNLFIEYFMQAFLAVTNIISGTANMDTLAGEMHNLIKAADIGHLFAILKRNASLNDRILELEAEYSKESE